MHARRLLTFAWSASVIAFALVGWALSLWTFVMFWPGAGYDAHTYWQAARDVVAGSSPYSGTYGGLQGFRYAPPLAALLAPGAFVSFDAFKLVMLALNVGALRYAVGSWRWAGIMLVNPLVLHELYLGNVNFPIAAALYAAFRSSTSPLAFAGLAKLSPFFVLPQLLRSGRRLKPFLVTLGAAIALTLPVLSLWPAWASALLTSPTPPGTLPFDLGPRLLLAVCLVAVAWYRRADWIAALAATIAVPILWPSTLVILLAPARMLVEEVVASRALGRRVNVERAQETGRTGSAWPWRPRPRAG